jgi:hypothetical protein
MLSRGLECFRRSWNTSVHGCNAFDRVGIPLYRVGILSRGLECFLEGWHTFLGVGMHSRVLGCFRQSWNTFVQRWNAF